MACIGIRRYTHELVFDEGDCFGLFFPALTSSDLSHVRNIRATGTSGRALAREHRRGDERRQTGLD